MRAFQPISTYEANVRSEWSWKNPMVLKKSIACFQDHLLGEFIQDHWYFQDHLSVDILLFTWNARISLRKLKNKVCVSGLSGKVFLAKDQSFGDGKWKNIHICTNLFIHEDIYYRIITIGGFCKQSWKCCNSRSEYVRGTIGSSHGHYGIRGPRYEEAWYHYEGHLRNRLFCLRSRTGCSLTLGFGYLYWCYIGQYLTLESICNLLLWHLGVSKILVPTGLDPWKKSINLAWPI